MKNLYKANTLSGQFKTDQDRSKTDWKRLDAMADEDIDYSDIPELGPGFWENALVVDPGKKQPITIRVDRDVLAWYKGQGGRYQVLMNRVLRQYMEGLSKK